MERIKAWFDSLTEKQECQVEAALSGFLAVCMGLVFIGIAWVTYGG